MSAEKPRSRSRIRKVLRVALVLVAVVAVLVVLVGIWGWSELKASLPQLEGQRSLPGLSASVTVERDGLGIPTITASSRPDLAQATGFLHAQDRFFQMDLSRRRSAGELSELLGELALEADRSARRHRFRAVAEEAFSQLEPTQRALLEAYADGVNQGLAALGSRPFEYLVLRAEPETWRPEDSLLVLDSMFMVLQSTGRTEAARGVMQALMPEEMVEFLSPAGTSWDAPLLGSALLTPPVPGPEIYDLATRSTDPAAEEAAAAKEAAPVPGSNNWAVAGEFTANGEALLAVDMHLPLRVPNTWYRARFVLDAETASSPVTGVTLPGVPLLVAGSNGHIAWGFTNTQGDWSDLVLLDADPEDPERYLTPAGPQEYQHFKEVIQVKGGEPQTVDVVWTIWGPVWDDDALGRPVALHWVAHQSEAINLHHAGFETVETIEQAFELAHGNGIPAQNLVVADSGGRIGWTVLGVMPRRVGFDGRVPTSWADGTRRWDGWLDSDEYPVLLDPPQGRIWTANNRTVDGVFLERMGDGGYGLGARAGQIRDGLMALEAATPQDMLAIQLDDRALFLARWRELILDLLNSTDPGSPNPRESYREHVQQWGGRAAADSVGYRLVRGFRSGVFTAALKPLLAPCRELDEGFRLSGRQAEGAVWQLITQRPGHLLDPEYENWSELLLAVIDDQIEEAAARPGGLDAMTWGRQNSSSITHPLAGALPFLAKYLNMPALELDGDTHMPRVQRRSFGASQRMVVSPGREEEGIFHMPTGQCAHPLSPHYRDSHQAWVSGDPTPFLPGATRHTLVFEPAP